MMWSMAKRRRRQLLPAQPMMAISLRISRAGPDALEACDGGCSREVADARRTALARSPESPDYKPKYYGDLRARDAAYHQGTVWAWLIGPYIDAWLKVHPGRSGRRAKIPGRLRPPSGRCLHRLDQRNLRCRAALHSARLHRTSLERGRGAAVLGEDGFGRLRVGATKQHSPMQEFSSSRPAENRRTRNDSCDIDNPRRSHPQSAPNHLWLLSDRKKCDTPCRG